MAVHDSLDDIEFNPYKWVHSLERIERLARGQDVYPVTVEIDLVGHCNHNCGWCVDPRHVPCSMDRHTVSWLLHELISLGVKGIVLKGGGEGTLYAGYDSVLEECHRLGFETGIITNGSRLHDLAAPMAQFASYVRISIDGPDRQSHFEIHGSDDFEQIISGIEGLLAAKRALGKRHPIIGLSFAMDHALIDKVDIAASLGNTLGVDYMLFRPPFFEEVGRTSTMDVEQKERLFSAFERARDCRKGRVPILIDYWISDAEAAALSSRAESPRRGRAVRDSVNGIEHITGTCLASPLLAVVTADLGVYPCCNLRLLDQWRIGTLDYEAGDTFARIWESANRNRVLERIHRVECLTHCTHPLSKYNEIIHYLRRPGLHAGFV